MPRRNKRGSRRTKGGRRNGRATLMPGLQTDLEATKGGVRVKFCLHSRFTGSTTIAASNLNPLNTNLFGAECVAFAQLFQEFKLIDLKIKMMPFKSLAVASGNSDTGYGIGWHPILQGSTDATIDDVLSATKSLYMNDSFTQPGELRITARDFAKHNIHRWYLVNGAAPVDDSTQGILTLGSAGTNGGTIVITWLIESTWLFRSPCASGKFLNQKDEKGLSPCPGVVPDPAPRCAYVDDAAEDSKVPVSCASDPRSPPELPSDDEDFLSVRGSGASAITGVGPVVAAEKGTRVTVGPALSRGGPLTVRLVPCASAKK